MRDLLESGLRQHQAGHLEEAKRIYEQILASQPGHPDALHLLGVVALQSGSPGSAVTLLEKAALAQPENPAFHADLAQAFLGVERAADAHREFRRAAELDPRNPQFAVGAAITVALQGHSAEAERQLRSVTQIYPGYALAWYNLGNLLRDGRRLEEAAESYQRAVQLDPAFADAHGNLGHVLHRAERFDDAEQAYRRYLALRPDSVTGYFNLASLLIDRGRSAEAAAACHQGIHRCQGSAEESDLRCMLGSALVHQGRLAAALDEFRLAAARTPNNARAQWGYGLALLHCGIVRDGLQHLERARELEPDSPDFQHSMGGVYLGVGDLEAGWREYQWRPARRWYTERHPGIHLALEAPGGVAGNRVLVLREQGLGDELFFLRFAPGLKLRGASITYCAKAKIASLLQRVPALDRVITEDVPLPPADLVVLVGDLPRILGSWDCSPYPAPSAVPRNPGAATNRKNNGALFDPGFLPCWPRVFCPEPPPPLALAALPQQLRAMAQRLDELGPPPYLGLTWRAGTAPEQQKGADWVLHKEIPLEWLAAAVRGVDGTLLAVQRNPQPGEIEALSARAARPVHDVTALNEDLEAMLALLALIDDYIGVSNTNMHLRAGAGRTARVLVSRPAEWRWLVAGDKSPWFPGFRIYRQKLDGDWGAALNQLSQDLRAQFGGQ